MITIWTYKNRTGTAVFIKKRPKPTANPKMDTVTALEITMKLGDC